jgi:DNA-binding NarL/FixJ family response regulator
VEFRVGQGLRIVVADGLPIMGLGLGEALTSLGYAVAARVETAGELLAAVERCEPEIVLVDLTLEHVIPAVEAIRSAGAGAPHVVLLAEAEHHLDLIVAGVCAGAVGSIPRSVSGVPLGRALMALRAGESLIPRALVPDVLAELRLRAESDNASPSSRISALTTRERQVLEMMRAGMSTATIAARLVVEPVTVRTHICAIRRKLHLHEGGAQHMTPLRAS